MGNIEITRVIESITVDGVVYVRQQNPELPQRDDMGRWIFISTDGSEDELVCSDIYSDNPEIFKKTYSFTLTSITVGGDPMIEE